MTITVSIGSGDEMVSIPNVRGVKAADAQATLEKKGLIVTVEEAYDENAGVGEGEVYAQTPKAGNRVEAGTSVTIKVLNKNAASNGSGETQNGESVEAGQWATPEDVNIEKPSNYQGTSVTIKVLNKNAASNGSGETQNGESVEAGQWATPEDVNIEKPSNYQGGQVRLRLVQDGDGSQRSGETQNGESVEAGQWATPEDVNIEKPSNYQGGQVRLRLVQDGDGSQSSGGKVILSDKVLEFSEKGGYNVGRIVGKEGVRYAFVWYRTETAARVAEEKLFFPIRCWNSVKKAATM